MTPRTPPAGAARVLAAVIVALVLVQAVIAGRSNRLFGSWNIGLHGTLGNIVFALAIANLAVVARRRASRGLVVTAAALVAVLTAQLGLGYAGRDSLAAAGWHIPVGVAAFGLAVWNLALLTTASAGRS